MKRIFSLLALIVIFTAVALADIRVPERTPLPTPEPEIVNSESGAAWVPGFTRTQTIAGGLFISLAIVCAGILFVRSRKISASTV